MANDVTPVPAGVSDQYHHTRSKNSVWYNYELIDTCGQWLGIGTHTIDRSEEQSRGEDQTAIHQILLQHSGTFYVGNHPVCVCQLCLCSLIGCNCDYKAAILFRLSCHFVHTLLTKWCLGHVGQRYNAGGTAGAVMKYGRWRFKTVKAYVMGGARL
jgi:hypothetical protein